MFAMEMEGIDANSFRLISSLTRRTKDDIVFGMKTTNRLKRRRIMTVKEFRARFGDDDQCARYLARERWPNGFLCPRCGGRSRGYMASRRVEECADCGYQCSVTAGTIFHKTRVPLTGWFWAIYRMGQDKKGISALQLSKEIGVSYPTAWLLQHKIRKAMADRDQRYQLSGLIEVDEGYAGGAEQGDAQKGRGAKTKSVLAVAVERLAPVSGRGETHPWVCSFGRDPRRGGPQPARISASQSPTRQSGAERRLERIPRAGAARLSAHGHSFTRGSGGGTSTFPLGAHYSVQPEALFARHSP